VIPNAFFLYAETVVKESRRGGNGGQNIQSIYQNNEGREEERKRKKLVGILMNRSDGETQRPPRPSSPVRLSERTDFRHQISSGS
jgi:hypothetical protein